TGSKDLKEALTLAGGPASDATRELPLQLFRRGAGDLSRRTLVPLSDGSELPDLALERDDQVVLPSVAELQRSVLILRAIAGARPGEEGTNKRVPYSEGDTVLGALDRAGGVTASADLARGYLRRSDGSILSIDLEALLVRRDRSADRPLQMDDTIVIPAQREAVRVEGAVLRPSTVAFNPNLRLLDYVAQAGGPSRLAEGPN